MSSQNPVGNSQTVSTSTSSAKSSAISQQSDSVRIYAESVGVYVAIGTEPIMQIQISTSVLGNQRHFLLDPLFQQKFLVSQLEQRQSLISQKEPIPHLV